jgi:hypothetical protein
MQPEFINVSPEAETEIIIRRRADIVAETQQEHGSGGYSRDQKRALWWIVGIISAALVSATVRHEVMLSLVVQSQSDTKEAVHEIRDDIKAMRGGK